MIKLDEHEQHMLQALLDDFSARAHYLITLNKLLNNWRVFVADVERGYPAGAYEYDNDLASRDLLQDIIELGPDTLRQQLVIQLEPWDVRFRGATYACAEKSTSCPRSDRWWWDRMPKKEVNE